MVQRFVLLLEEQCVRMITYPRILLRHVLPSSLSDEESDMLFSFDDTGLIALMNFATSVLSSQATSDAAGLHGAFQPL